MADGLLHTGDSASTETTTGSSPGPSTRSKSWLTWMLQGIPTLLSFAILAGVFWAGHHYEWKLPKYSQIFGAAETPKLA